MTKLNSQLMAILLVAVANISMAADINKIHFLIPCGAGGGWDGTARGVGEVLYKTGLVNLNTINKILGLVRLRIFGVLSDSQLQSAH